LIVATLVLLLGSMVWMVQDRHNAAPLTVLAAEQTVATTTVAEPASALPSTAPELAPVAAATTPVPQSKSSPAVHVDASGEVKYVARAGDTVSQLAVALLGSESKAHRDAMIGANASLQSNPDRVLVGQTYLSVGRCAQREESRSER
jgi:nucleoid-associated protein YgaU